MALPSLAFLMLLLTVSAQEKADAESTALIQLCPVTTKVTPESRMYHFEHAVKKSNSDNFSSGYYDPKAIVDFRDVSSIDIDTVEMATAPFRGIVIGFTEGGYKKLGDYFNGTEPRELVLTLDGHTYSVIKVDTLKETVKAKGKFIVFIAEPYSDIGKHLITLLVDKLRAHLPKSKGEQGGADQPATSPESKSGGKKKPKPESKAGPQ